VLVTLTGLFHRYIKVKFQRKLRLSIYLNSLSGQGSEFEERFLCQSGVNFFFGQKKLFSSFLKKK
jgi:hypothetical protein